MVFAQTSRTATASAQADAMFTSSRQGRPGGAGYFRRVGATVPTPERDDADHDGQPASVALSVQVVALRDGGVGQLAAARGGS